MHLIDNVLKPQTICINHKADDLGNPDYTIVKTSSIHTHNWCTKLNGSQELQEKSVCESLFGGI